jgi:DNA (cytosine-5)-methyltransferase 1
MLTVGSLFSGIGGLDLALEHAGMRVVWQVENDLYCQRVLAEHWPEVPRYEDVTQLDFARLGPVDLVAAGFPCQPTSQAGRRKAQQDPRWLWPEVARCLRALRPRYVWLENTLGLLSRGFDDVLGDLAALGFDAEWDCFQAADVGAPHQRDRVFVLAYTQGLGVSQQSQGTLADPERGGLQRRGDPGVLDGAAGPGTGEGPQRQRDGRTAGDCGADGAALADPEQQGLAQLGYARPAVGELAGRGAVLADPDRQGRDQRHGSCGDSGRQPGPADNGHVEHAQVQWGEPDRRLQQSEDGDPQRGLHLRQPQPGLGRDADGPSRFLDGHRWPAPPGPDQYPWEPPRTVGKGVPHRARRVKALGNAVVPQQGALAFAVLWQRMLVACAGRSM